MVKKEVEETLREIQMEGFGIVLIAHSVEKTQTDTMGKEFDRFVPNLPKKAMEVANGFVDNIIFCTPVGEGFADNKVMGFLRGTNRWIAGSRFKYIPDKIELDYDNLVEAIATAVEKQEEMVPGSTADIDVNKGQLSVEVAPEIPFDELQNNCMKLIEKILETNPAYGQKIQVIVDSVLGVGKKLKETNVSQQDFVQEIHDQLLKLLGATQQSE